MNRFIKNVGGGERMPKIIEQLRERLMLEAKQQIHEQGYAETTIRSVAAACGVGVGTVYNYFKSKEMLIATVVYEDWKKYLQRMSDLPIDDERILLRGIFDSLRRFSCDHERLFSDSDAAKLVSVGSSARHKMLRDQIASFILPICEKNRVSSPDFTAKFIAESIICWSMEEKDFDELYPILEKIIKT
jgi:AcrR family transcriptional regulator